MKENATIDRSLYEGVKALDKSLQSELWTAVLDYVFTGKEAELSGTSKVIWTLLKPTIDSLNKKPAKVTAEKRKEEPLSHGLQKYIAEELKNVSKLKIQLSYKEAQTLTEKYPKQLIKDKLLAMENKADLTKKYTSVYLTLNNWCKDAAPVTAKSDEYTRIKEREQKLSLENIGR
jgi:hypothetical protein